MILSQDFSSALHLVNGIWPVVDLGKVIYIYIYELTAQTNLPLNCLLCATLHFRILGVRDGYCLLIKMVYVPW